MKAAEEMTREKKNVQWSGYGELGNISQKPLQPTAEGAEEFLRRHNISGHDFVYATGFENMVGLLDEFAALYAQQIADKMVGERLRKELIAFGKVVRSWGIAIPSDILECSIDEYLKSRER